MVPLPRNNFTFVNDIKCQNQYPGPVCLTARCRTSALYTQVGLSLSFRTICVYFLGGLLLERSFEKESKVSTLS